MVQALKNRMKNEKGFTLIELLAVIVILGIIAAIAVPSVLSIMDNSRKDAHIANAQQLVDSAKMAVANDSTAQPTDGNTTGLYLSLTYLQSKGYIDTIKDPDGGSYVVDPAATAPASTVTANTTYVQVTNSGGTYSYKVAIYGSKRHIVLLDLGSIDRTKVVPN